jgi:hypothetical protein
MRRGAVIVLLLTLAFAGVPALAKQAVFFGGDVAGLERQRPAFIHLTSDQNIRQIHWTSWGGAVARGRGTIVFSASDKVAPAPLRLELSRIRRCGKHLRYLRLRASDVSPRPRADSNNFVLRYTCRSPF